jgi:hypothetical protein
MYTPLVLLVFISTEPHWFVYAGALPVTGRAACGVVLRMEQWFWLRYHAEGLLLENACHTGDLVCVSVGCECIVVDVSQLVVVCMCAS